MKVELGKIYVNKTWKYLIPTLQGYGDDLVTKLNLVFKLAVGIHDSYLDGAGITEGKNLYLLVDKSYEPENYEKFMGYIREQKYFKGEYCPEKDVVTSKKHTIIIEIPERFFKAYDKFLQSKYSEMYTKAELTLIFKNKSTPTYDVLSKTGQETFNKYKKFVDKEFKVESDLETLKSGEWDLPLKKVEEIFNFKKGDSIFFNEKLDKVWQ
tara:strand:- start:49 stop:678 length:630 start_codon:yes stop_codon:yes gene_type:complete